VFRPLLFGDLTVKNYRLSVFQCATTAQSTALSNCVLAIGGCRIQSFGCGSSLAGSAFCNSLHGQHRPCFWGSAVVALMDIMVRPINLILI